MKIRQGF